MSNTKYIVKAQGAPLEVVQCPVPADLSPTDVLVCVKAVAVNPADCKMIDHGHRGMSYPLVAGLDGAGTIEAVGSQVTGFQVGDDVLALFAAGDRGGSYQRYAIVDQSKVAKKGNLSFEEAASVGVCYFTAVMGLGIGLGTRLPFVRDGPAEGSQPSSVLVLGGSSALGAATIQLLRVALPQCKVLTTASPKHHAHVTQHLGAHAAFDRSSPSLVADIRAFRSRDDDDDDDQGGVEAIIDTVGAGASQQGIFQALAPDGMRRYAQVWTGDEEIRAPEGVDSVLFRSRDFGKIQGGDNIMAGLQSLLEERRFKVPLPVRVVGAQLQGLRDGLDLMRNGVSGEKLVVTL